MQQRAILRGEPALYLFVIPARRYVRRMLSPISARSGGIDRMSARVVEDCGSQIRGILQCRKLGFSMFMVGFGLVITFQIAP